MGWSGGVGYGVGQVWGEWGGVRWGRMGLRGVGWGGVG